MSSWRHSSTEILLCLIWPSNLGASQKGVGFPVIFGLSHFSPCQVRERRFAGYLDPCSSRYASTGKAGLEPEPNEGDPASTLRALYVLPPCILRPACVHPAYALSAPRINSRGHSFPYLIKWNMKSKRPICVTLPAFLCCFFARFTSCGIQRQPQ